MHLFILQLFEIKMSQKPSDSYIVVGRTQCTVLLFSLLCRFGVLLYRVPQYNAFSLVPGVDKKQHVPRHQLPNWDILYIQVILTIFCLVCTKIQIKSCCFRRFCYKHKTIGGRVILVDLTDVHVHKGIQVKCSTYFSTYANMCCHSLSVV